MKRYYPRTNEPSTNPDGSSVNTIIRTCVTFGEWQKNQAEHIGGYAVDGCMEFMPSGAEGTPAALTCAACGSHRSYHQIEVHIEIVWNDPPPPLPSATQGAWAVNFMCEGIILCNLQNIHDMCNLWNILCEPAFTFRKFNDFGLYLWRMGSNSRNLEWF